MQHYKNLYELLETSIEGVKGSLNRNPAELYEPQKYILSLGGKRLRPLLTLISNDLFNGKIERALAPAMAVELFHNFSLIHDDIMDKAPLRRGKQTVHEKWNSNIAILSGDAMLVEAYAQLAKSESVYLPDLLRTFNVTATEVCEGQQMDMNFESLAEISIENYLEMIRLKTAVLLACSLKMGAITAGADKNDLIEIYNVGIQLGIAFQLQDDMLDVYSIDGTHGKQVGGDIISNKKTWLLLKCMALCNSEQKTELTNWLNQMDFNPDAKVKAVKQIFDQCKVDELCKLEIQVHFRSAIHSLSNIKISDQKKQVFSSFISDLMNRKA